MKVRGIVFEDFVNYKEPALYIAMPYCSFKCDKECGHQVCQNEPLTQEPIVDIDKEDLIEEFLNNSITRAVVFGGLEPLDSFMDVLSFVDSLRRQHDDLSPIIIYTGYTEEEVEAGAVDAGPQDLMAENWRILCSYPGIIVKFGRFRPNEESHLDKLLGVRLASPNQYARLVSNENHIQQR